MSAVPEEPSMGASKGQQPQEEAVADVQEQAEQPEAARLARREGNDSASPLEDDDDDDDENEICGFCKFMKGGGCKQAFNDWSACVDKERDAGGDFTEECRDVTMRLRECMLANKEYYAPLLEEEEEEARQAAEAEEAAAAGVEPEARAAGQEG